MWPCVYLYWCEMFTRCWHLVMGVIYFCSQPGANTSCWSIHELLIIIYSLILGSVSARSGCTVQMAQFNFDVRYQKCMCQKRYQSSTFFSPSALDKIKLIIWFGRVIIFKNVSFLHISQIINIPWLSFPTWKVCKDFYNLLFIFYFTPEVFMLQFKHNE